MGNQSLDGLTLKNREIKWFGLTIPLEKKEGPILED